MKQAASRDLLSALFAVARQEAAKRKKTNRWADKAAHLRSLLMAIQARLEADLARRVSVRSPRQTGKSTGVMLIVLIRCLETAMAEWIVVGLTRPSIKGIYWLPLKQLNQAFELGITFHNQELTATLPNGSVIRFVGAENVGEIEKLRGGRYNGVIIDECKSFAARIFEELVHDVIEPALMAKNGQLFVIGTPGDDLDGPFYLATCEEPLVIKGLNDTRILSNAPYGSTPELPFVWSLHSWDLSDNTTVFPDGKGGTYTMWDQALIIKARNGWSDDHPTWRREFLGHWVPNDVKRVYRYRPALHDYTPLHDTKWGVPEAVGGYKTVIALDLGTRDGTGIVVWAWNPFTQDLWELYSGKRRAEPGDRLPVSQIAAWYHELEAEYGPFTGWPSDPGGLATMVHDTLAEEYGVYLEPADKREKGDHVELMNNDFDAGMIHIRRGSELSVELRDARWNPAKLDKGRKEEDPKVPNDVADAALYGFRWCTHRRASLVVRQHTMFSPEWWGAAAAAELSDARKRAADRADPDSPRLDREWWNDGPQ